MDRSPVEQRLIDALRSTERVDPSPDLWSRVVHSIDEDRAHRRRVRAGVQAAFSDAAPGRQGRCELLEPLRVNVQGSQVAGVHAE